MSNAYALAQLEPSAPADPRAARALVESALNEAEAIRERARADGLAQGHAEGLQQGLAAAQAAAQTLAVAAQELRDAREAAADALEADAVALALALAEKVVIGAIEAQPARVLDVVRGALRHIADRRAITILVNPADMESTSAAIEELRSSVGGVEQCEVQADRRIGRGGAIVRTSEGEIDACVNVQLQQAREFIASELGLAALPALGPARQR